MQLYNTLTRRKELFVPLEPGRVRMYFCGPTVYSDTHIGHLRPALTGDLLARYLRYQGFRVEYVSNLTDVDDKIIQRARDEGVPAREVADRYAGQYLELMRRMGVDQVDRYVRITESMAAIVEAVGELVEGGHAYASEGDVYFSVRTHPGYGKLSGRDPDELLAGARVEVSEKKRDPLDFALWKAAKPEEPSWPSPWGAGRPGWHIECSVMCRRFLGPTLDIHGGGADLIFPHHENEIAQSEALNGAPLARYWVHNGMVRVGEEKMAKSLGNYFTVERALELVSPEALRLYIFSTHYRNPLFFSVETLQEAARAQERLQHADQLLAEAAGDLAEEARPDPEEPFTASLLASVASARQDFLAALDDDLNSAEALAALFDLARRLNAHLQSREFAGLPEQRAALAQARVAFRELAALLGVLHTRSAPAAGGPSGAASPSTAEDAGLNERLIELLLSVRELARARRDWKEADLIRSRLQELGIAVEDRRDGPHWRWARPPRQSPPAAPSRPPAGPGPVDALPEPPV
ncbi:MAG: cysteine--tRNA ligase [Bacillota bacterium]|nr:cysteine--tRNA ligase [Bacillota bacterium]